MGHKVFIDSSAFIAMDDKSDQYHDQGTALAKRIFADASLEMYTSNLVMAESYTRILYRTHLDIALSFLQLIDNSGIEILYANSKVESSARSYFLKYSSLKISYTDAVSFQLMKEYKIKSAFTFDKHFEIVGFDCLTDH